MVGAELAVPTTVLPAPEVPGSLAGEDAEVPAGGDELLAGGGEDFVWVLALVEVLTDGATDVHAGVGEAAGDLAPVDVLAGGPLAPVPGAGVLVPGAGDVVVDGGGVTGGGVVAGGVGGGLVLVEPVVPAGGLALWTAGGVVHVGPGPG